MIKPFAAAVALLVSLAAASPGQSPSLPPLVSVERPTALGRALFGPIVRGHQITTLQPSAPRQTSPYCHTGGCNGGGYYQQCVPGGGCTIVPAPTSRWQTIRSTPVTSPPVQPQAPNPPKIDQDAIVAQVVERLIERIKSDAELRLLLMGPTGPTGSDGANAVIDYDVLIQQIVDDLPPVRMAIRRPDGSTKISEKPLGDWIGIDISSSEQAATLPGN